MKLPRIPDSLRNANVLIVGSILNFSFALEKYFLMIGQPKPDSVWFWTYGGLGLFLTIVAVYDYVCDTVEGIKTDVERLI